MKKLFSLIVTVVFALTAAAQTLNVRGVVLQASDQEPIAGATVKAKGTTIGTQTDDNGEFRLTMLYWKPVT